MAVRSVRLPEDLWQRLGATLARINEDRRRPVSLSSLLRALLEQGLADPGGAPDLDAGVLRPERVKRAGGAVPAAAAKSPELHPVRGTADPPGTPASLFDDVKRIVRRTRMSPAAFARSVGADPKSTTPFYYDGKLPEGEAGAELARRLHGWLTEQA